MIAQLLDTRLELVAGKVERGERLSFDDGLAVFRSDDLMGVGWLANSVRWRLHGKKTYFNVNRHLNPTNLCYVDCAFCSFDRKVGQPGAYTYTIEQCLEKARAAYAEGATELHITGGLNVKLPFSYFTDLLSTLKRELPSLHLKGFTMVELDHFAHFYKMSDDDVIAQLHAAGLDSCPGGGAEIFAPEVREKICDHKCDSERWLSLAGKVHQTGMHTNATMLYGHIESVEDRVDHLIRLREQQDKTGGFQCMIPLAFHPAETVLSHLPGPSGIDSLKTIAVSRLMLDNFPHIKAYWVMLGKRLAQVALHFGANDIDGTITQGGELVSSYAHDSDPDVQASKNEIIRLITEAGLEAVERDTVYKPLRVYSAEEAIAG